MKESTLLILVSVLCYSQTLAQIKVSDNAVGTNHLIHSEILGEDRKIQIQLPEGYDHSDTSYPVVYVLDGQRFFLHTVGLTTSFMQYDFTPEFIVVGITNKYPDRFKHFGDGKEKFIEFMVKELIPYVNQSHRTKNENILFGWEFGGGLVFNTLFKYPEHFNGFLIASPYPINAAIDKLNQISELNKMLLFSVSPDEYEINHDLNKLDSLLTAKNIKGLNWSNLKLDAEEHRSTGYSTIYHGLRKYFEFYPELEVNNLSRFVEAGGMEYAFDYAQKRHNQYGFDAELSLWSKFTIVRSAIRAEDIEHFEAFIEKLDNESFIRELTSSNWSYGASDIDLFYEKNSKYDKALKVYDIMLEKYPNSEKLLEKRRHAVQNR